MSTMSGRRRLPAVDLVGMEVVIMAMNRYESTDDYDYESASWSFPWKHLSETTPDEYDHRVVYLDIATARSFFFFKLDVQWPMFPLPYSPCGLCFSPYTLWCFFITLQCSAWIWGTSGAPDTMLIRARGCGIGQTADALGWSILPAYIRWSWSETSKSTAAIPSLCLYPIVGHFDMSVIQARLAFMLPHHLRWQRTQANRNQRAEMQTALTSLSKAVDVIHHQHFNHGGQGQ